MGYVSFREGIICVFTCLFGQHVLVTLNCCCSEAILVPNTSAAHSQASKTVMQKNLGSFPNVIVSLTWMMKSHIFTITYSKLYENCLGAPLNPLVFQTPIRITSQFAQKCRAQWQLLTSFLIQKKTELMLLRRGSWWRFVQSTINSKMDQSFSSQHPGNLKSNEGTPLILEKKVDQVPTFFSRQKNWGEPF